MGPLAKVRGVQLKHVPLPDFTQESISLPLTVGLGSPMMLFPSETDLETKIQVQVVYLAVIPKNTRQAMEKWSWKQLVRASIFTVWATKAPSYWISFRD